MSTHNRNTYAHSTHFHIRMHNFPRLVVHFHLLLRIQCIGKHIYLRNYVICQLIIKFLYRRFISLHQLFILMDQLCHCRCPSTAGSLICSYVYGLYMRQIFDSFQCYNHLNCRTIWIGNHSSRTNFCIRAIHLRNDQRHIVIHTKSARVIDHHSSIFRNRRFKLFWCSCTGRSKSNVHAFKIVIMLQLLHYNFFIPENIFRSGTTRRAEQQQFIYRKISFVQYTEKLLAYRTACTNNSYFHFFVYL